MLPVFFLIIWWLAGDETVRLTEPKKSEDEKMKKYLAIVLTIGILGITGCGVRMRIPNWPPSDSRVAENEEARKAHFIVGQLAAEKGDLVTAIEEFRPLAETGHVLAQATLGSIYANGGRGVPQNDKEAVKWHRLAAEQGHVLSQYDLGVMYATDRGVSQDDKEAVKWFRLAAEQGDAKAQYNLGLMYNKGRGVSQNNKEAVKWYRLAAEQGDAPAQFALGDSYFRGKDVSQDDKEAMKWFRLAAEQRHVKAQYNLGVMYAIGARVPQDNIQAYMWLSLARNEIPRARQIRDKVSAKMGPSEIAKAQRLVREWQAAKARN